MKITVEMGDTLWDLADAATVMSLQDHYENRLQEAIEGYVSEDEIADGIRVRAAIQVVLAQFMLREDYNEWLQDVQQREPDILA